MKRVVYKGAFRGLQALRNFLGDCSASVVLLRVWGLGLFWFLQGFRLKGFPVVQLFQASAGGFRLFLLGMVVGFKGSGFRV